MLLVRNADSSSRTSAGMLTVENQQNGRYLMIYAEQGTILYRQINALSWRVASEIARRDNSIYIGLTGDGGSASHADALMLTGEGGRAYQARRCGSGFIAGHGPELGIPWEHALQMNSAREIAVALERLLGLEHGKFAKATTPRALGYGVMASLLELTLGDRRTWQTHELEGGPLERNSNTRGIRRREYEDTRWKVACDGQVVAEFDNYGSLHVEGRTVDLYSRYRALNGRIYPVVFELLGGLL
jgi:hypothetical protein